MEPINMYEYSAVKSTQKADISIKYVKQTNIYLLHKSQTILKTTISWPIHITKVYCYNNVILKIIWVYAQEDRCYVSKQ